MQTFDAIIIGGGAAGLSIAAELAPLMSVVVLERERQCAYHSTGRSAAKFIANYGNSEVRKLNRVSRVFFEQTPFDVWEHPVLHPRGLYYIALPGCEPALEAVMQDAVGMAYIEPDQISREMPLVRPGVISHAVFESGVHDIDVSELLQGYRRLIQRHQSQIQCDAEALSIDRRNGLWQVQTRPGDYKAPLIVNAAGAWADPVAQMAGLVPLGITPMRRSAAIIPLPKELDSRSWPFIVSAAEDFYFGPEAGKLLVSPADETPVAPHDAYADDMALAVAIDKIQNLLNFEINRVEHSWGGLRSFSPDRTQVIGFDPRTEGFFWHAGQGGFGIQSAPGAAQLAGALIKGQSVSELLQQEGVDPAVFAVERILTSE